MKYTEEERQFFEKRSMENLIENYRPELLRIVGGENCYRLLSGGVRRRFREYGILKKFGNRYEITPRGREMLGVVDDAEG